jgi:hypothetical protein
MRRHVVSEWERRLREVALNLTSSVQEIFGRTEAVSYPPPDSTPQRESGPADARPPRVPRAAGKGDRLPPRERRGRD